MMIHNGTEKIWDTRMGNKGGEGEEGKGEPREMIWRYDEEWPKEKRRRHFSDWEKW